MPTEPIQTVVAPPVRGEMSNILRLAVLLDPPKLATGSSVQVIPGDGPVFASHDLDGMLQHLVNEWGALGTARKLRDGVPADDRRFWVHSLSLPDDRYVPGSLPDAWDPPIGDVPGFDRDDWNRQREESGAVAQVRPKPPADGSYVGDEAPTPAFDPEAPWPPDQTGLRPRLAPAPAGTWDVRRAVPDPGEASGEEWTVAAETGRLLSIRQTRTGVTITIGKP